jgi:dipeptidyl aminopeptidase/acylaminoacyl peptidase
MLRRPLCAFAVTALLGPLGCGGGDQNEPARVDFKSRIKTERPELAYFTTHGSAIYDLGVADDRGDHRRVLTGESIEGSVFPQLFTRVSWSPDGTRLAFAGVRGEQTDEHREPTDIYTIKADGSDVKRITKVGDAGGPLWSPNGTTIFFTRTAGGRGEPTRGSFWSVEANGARLKEIAQADDWEIYAAGSFSSSGSGLAVTRGVFNPSTGEASSEIQLMKPDGSGRTRLIAQASDPAFSPDGKRIAFVSDRDKSGQLCYGDQCSYGGELYIANADGSDPKRLTKTKSLNEAHPTWLPDGSRIAYQRGEVFQNAEATSILQLNPDGSCDREILAGSGGGAWYASPAWRPTKARQGGGSLSC